MIVIAGHVRIQPQDRAVAIEAMTDMMTETKKEQGCISYDFSAAMHDETLFHLFEEWETSEHLDAHFASAHMATYRAVFASLEGVDRSIFRYSAGDKSAI